MNDTKVDRWKSLTAPRWQRALAVMAVALAWTGSALAVGPDETDPRKIMNAVDARPTPHKQTGRMQMTIIDASGSKRVRVVRSWSMDFPTATKQLIFFESPADVRNTGLLTVDHDDGAKVDDQWLYLPSLRKSTRISSNKKSGSFMGSDISFSDMTRQSPDQYDYKLVKASARVGEEDCWVIEARPRTKKVKEETGYVKSLVWISKDKLMALQMKSWVREGRKLKFMRFSRIKQIGGYWFAHKISAKTVQSKEILSTTVLSMSAIKVDDQADVSPADFKQNRLETGL